MSHEISHNLMRHPLRQKSKSFLNQFNMIWFFGAFEFPMLLVGGADYYGLFAKFKHSRVHESRADEWGIKIMHKAGFDVWEGPQMIVHLNQKIDKYTREAKEKAKKKAKQEKNDDKQLVAKTEKIEPMKSNEEKERELVDR